MRGAGGAYLATGIRLTLCRMTCTLTSIRPCPSGASCLNRRGDRSMMPKPFLQARQKSRTTATMHSPVLSAHTLTAYGLSPHRHVPTAAYSLRSPERYGLHVRRYPSTQLPPAPYQVASPSPSATGVPMRIAAARIAAITGQEPWWTSC